MECIEHNGYTVAEVCRHQNHHHHHYYHHHHHYHHHHNYHNHHHHLLLLLLLHDYHTGQVRLRQFEACISSGAVWDSLPITEKNTDSIEFEKLNEAVLNHHIIAILS